MEYFVVYDERTSLTKTDTTKEVETTEKNVAFQHIHSICNMSLSLYICDIYSFTEDKACTAPASLPDNLVDFPDPAPKPEVVGSKEGLH